MTNFVYFGCQWLARGVTIDVYKFMTYHQVIPYIIIQQENIRCVATQFLCSSERTKRVTEFKWLTVKLLVVIKFFSRLVSPPETYFKIVNKVAVIGLISRILQFGIAFSLDTV